MEKQSKRWLNVFLACYLITGVYCTHAACGAEPAPTTEMPSATEPPIASLGVRPFQGRVVETMDSGGYTYVLVDDGSHKIWAAAPKSTVTVGETVIVPKGVVMKSFRSNTLGRDFDWILFVANIGRPGTEQPDAAGERPAGHPSPAGLPSPPSGHPTIKGKSAPAEVDLSGIEKADGGQTVEEVFTRRADLTGKKVLVRGKVVKFTSQVMGTNWIHLRDGSGGEGTNDLTVTTKTKVAVGDTVTVSGVLAVDKDFGAGYSYNAIVENADVTIE